MAKDPAVLFYTSDFLTGTMLMSDEEVGQYIKLLCLQHQRGRLTENHMLTICKAKDNEVFNKFIKDDNGLYYNERMEDEAIKRKNFTESRKHNGSKGGRPKKSKPNAKPSGKPNAKPKQNLTEDENENENIDIIADRIYLSYPSKCVIKNSSTGKSAKSNKEKIKKLLSDYSEYELITKIKWYVKECETSKTYMKNFGTFLNNLPDGDISHSSNEKKSLHLFKCTHRVGSTKRYDCDTKEEARNLYYNYGGIYPDKIEQIR